MAGVTEAGQTGHPGPAAGAIPLVRPRHAGPGALQDSKGDFYAAGITYFTIFALFPLLMVGFAVGGFVLASRPELLAEIEDEDQVRRCPAISGSSWSS